MRPYLQLLLSIILFLPLPAVGGRLRTMKVMKEGNFMSAPTIRLGSDERISINFDEWSEDYSELQYRIVHCTADWQPSRLLESEYLDGFNIGDIDDREFSTNTFVHYVNYQLYIPNEQTNPKVAGNYKVEIFDRYNPDEVLGEARFSISEETARINATATTHTDRGMNTEWQQLEIEVIPTDVRIEDPYNDLTLTAVQNNVPWTERRLQTPSRIDGRNIIYQHFPQLIFKAGNEFRRFESIRTNYNDMHVDSVRYAGSNYHVWLTPDGERDSSEYSYDETQQGRFLVREYNATDSNLGADYVTVHFTLATPEVVDADVYVEGEFTGFRHDESTRLHYDHGAGVYRLEMPLKQGSYNYRYAEVARHGNRTPDTTLTEGNKYETRNEYRIQVWYNPHGARYPRLLTDFTLNP